MQATKAETHSLVSSALTAMRTAMTSVDGGLPAQLQALQAKIEWVEEPLELKLPVLCFALPPKRFDMAYITKWPYTEHGRTLSGQVLPVPLLSAMLRSSRWCELEGCTIWSLNSYTLVVQKMCTPASTKNPGMGGQGPKV